MLHYKYMDENIIDHKEEGRFASLRNKLKFGNFNLKQILKASATLLLVVGLGVGVYLVQTKQVFKSKATTNFIDAFEIKDQNGNILTCDGSTNPPTCTTSTLDITVRVKDPASLLP